MKQDAGLFLVAPVNQSSIDPGRVGVLKWVEHPFLLSGGRIEREHFEGGGGAVKNSICNQGIALDLKSCFCLYVFRCIFPGFGQLSHISEMDLLEGGVLRIGRVTAEMAPLGGCSQ